MAEGVNIPITATANTAGAVAMTRSLAALEAEVKQVTQQMRQMALDSNAFNESRVRLAALNDEISTLKTTKDKAAGSAVNFAQGMLQGSRAVQDFSAAGIPGMVNNVEGLAAALGMGAGAAAAFTLAFVGIDLLIKNWDTWFGPDKAQQAREFWSAMTPDEAQMVRLREMNEALDNQAKNLERIAEIRKADIQAQREEDELLKKKAELWKDITPTPEQRGDLPALPGMGPDTPEMREARRKLAERQAETQAKVGTFQGLDQATEEQRQRVQNMNRIASLPERVRLANERDARTLAGLDTSFDEAGMPNSPEAMRQAEALRTQMRQREAEMRAQIQSVPGLTDGLTGDPEKDREALQARAQAERERLNQLEQQRLQAARDAESAARAQAQAEQGVTGQQQLQTEQTAAKGFAALGLPPTPGQFAGADSMGGLTEALASSRAAAQQATTAAETVVSESSQLGQKMAGALGTLASALRSTRNELDALQSEFTAYRDANR